MINAGVVNEVEWKLYKYKMKVLDVVLKKKVRLSAEETRCLKIKMN